MPGYATNSTSLVRLKAAALPVATAIGPDVTARRLAGAMGWTYTTAKRALQGLRADGAIPAYVQPRAQPVARVRPAPTAAQREAVLEYKRRWRRRQIEATLAATPVTAVKQAAPPDDYRPDIEAETAKIRAMWTDAQRAQRDARPARGWQVPGTTGGARRGWNGLLMSPGVGRGEG